MFPYPQSTGHVQKYSLWFQSIWQLYVIISNIQSQSQSYFTTGGWWVRLGAKPLEAHYQRFFFCNWTLTVTPWRGGGREVHFSKTRVTGCGWTWNIFLKTTVMWDDGPYSLVFTNFSEEPAVCIFSVWVPSQQEQGALTHLQWAQSSSATCFNLRPNNKIEGEFWK
jgi:hypothetical protein